MSTHNRRDFLKASGASFAALGLPLPASHLKWAFKDERKPTLVVLFLRGGADALNVVVPYSDDRYYDRRPTLSVPRESSKGAKGVIALTDEFGLHPNLSALMPYWESGSLAPMVCTGSPHPTRSHFDAQDFMEYTAPGLRTVRQGWLNRFLTASGKKKGTRSEGSDSTLRGIAMQGLLPRSLRGECTVLAVPNKKVLGDHRILDLYGPMYREGMGMTPEEEQGETEDQDLGNVTKAGRDTFETLKKFRELVEGSREQRSKYPGTKLGERLHDLARVIRSGEELEVAAIDIGGWDTHINQGVQDTGMGNNLRVLGDSLAAFMKDIGSHAEQTLVMVMSEFGRTCNENGNYGTDHGHGGMMMLLGGKVRGGRIHGDWPGLEERDLYQRRDLQVTTDYRDIFAEVLREHMRFDLPKDFFPGYKPGRVRKLFS